MTPAQTLCFTEVHRFLAGLFEGGLHAKRVLSLANATLGVLKTASPESSAKGGDTARSAVIPFRGLAGGV